MRPQSLLFSFGLKKKDLLRTGLKAMCSFLSHDLNMKGKEVYQIKMNYSYSSLQLLLDKKIFEPEIRGIAINWSLCGALYVGYGKPWLGSL